MKKHTYISLFSSAGIGCYAFKELGFECIATSELLEKRLNIQKYNKKCKYDTGYIWGDISLERNKNKIFLEVDKWKDNDKISEVDLIVATPPCQGISVANHKKKDETSRNSLILQSLSIVKKLRPRFFVFENVRAFLRTICVDDEKERTISNAINIHLESIYNIEAKLINFKDFGSNSSRTRTLVIGVRKDIKDIIPTDLFPKEEKQKSVREIIGKYPSLENMGEIYSDDIYHYFRKYDKRMLPWIKNTKESYSAFDNDNPKHKPHSIKDGKLIPNTNKNRDKYRRCKWDEVMSCIHTRNDILTSQSTIHPRDNRVFSIRELMDLMTIPKSFKWLPRPFEELNQLSIKEKQSLLKKEDINIRQSIGEAVPTIIFKKVAKNILDLEKKALNIKQISEIISKSILKNYYKLYKFIENNPLKLSVDNLSKIIEIANNNKEQTAAFYTPKSICFDIVNKLPEIDSNTIHILEPSVGIGNFIPLMINKYKNRNLIIDVVDIDNNSLDLLKLLILKLPYNNFTINYNNIDFINYNPNHKYDIVIGNPPFGKIEDKTVLKKYRKLSYNKKTSNIFSFFIEHSLSLGNYVSLIMPKSFLSAPEYNSTRELLEKNTKILNIIDFGEKAFYGVKIETISLLLKNIQFTDKYIINVESYITEQVNDILSSDVYDKDFSIWLIYVDKFFKSIKSKLHFSVFDFFRDRSITKKHTTSSGKYRVLKSRNIGNDKILDIESYDTYVDNVSSFQVSKFLNSKSLLIPNLSYSPRACLMPKNAIADGSVAILQSKKYSITKEDINFFASNEFQRFYIIGRNLGSRSLNIDSNSIKLWGILKREDSN
jgi:DNA (cytosine-5)-methyltransferase 1